MSYPSPKSPDGPSRSSPVERPVRDAALQAARRRVALGTEGLAPHSPGDARRQRLIAAWLAELASRY